jgi:poly(beta-D-mannuronate) lyase
MVDWLGRARRMAGNDGRTAGRISAQMGYDRRRATAEQRQIIEPWLIRFADVAIAFFDNRDRKRNNHWYWLGLGVAATALATDSERHWVVARDIMRDAASDIRDDGILPLELDRKARALHYHVFAMMPLIVLAEVGAARGEDWYALADGALHRLVGVTMKGLVDADTFSLLASEPQEAPVEPGAGWLQLYGWRFPERLVDDLPDVPLGHRWLGGDTAILSQVLKKFPSSR